ncbi:MAG TPA: pyridoxal-phosphate dependent enzyme [Pseudomonadales bacterium]|nr:pyridoxal-phosphate dependent enzyme [Pseudomonadales bacterium]
MTQTDLLPNYKGVELRMLRLDELDPEISGNKWFKLKPNLLQARAEQHTRLLSFGGCYSNHLHALAAAGQRFGFSTVGIVRGEAPKHYSPTLLDLQRFGMQLRFISRSDYRNKNQADFQNALKREFGHFYLIPEGGCNVLGVRGCEEIVTSIYAHNSYQPDFIVLSCGTGTTLAGVIRGVAGRCHVIGIAALKGARFLEQDVLDLMKEAAGLESSPQQACSTKARTHQNWHIEYDYAFGGFAKVNAVLLDFMAGFERETSIKLDPVYTGKMLFAVYDLIKRLVIPAGAKVLVIHTGGLQGLRGLRKP